MSFIIGSAAFLIAAMLTEHLVLSAIIGGIFSLPSLIGGLKCVKGETEDAMYIGAKIINYSAAAMRTAYYHLSDWIHNTVVPVMWPKWEAASTFVRKHVIEPGAEFICKIRNRAAEGCAAAKEKLGTFIDEVNDTANRVATQMQNHPAPVHEEPVAAAPQGEIYTPLWHRRTDRVCLSLSGAKHTHQLLHLPAAACEALSDIPLSARRIAPGGRLSKNFDSLVDGGASSPATAPPHSTFFSRAPKGTTEKCKEAIFPSENQIFLRKNRCGRAVHAAATDFISHSSEVFDKLRPAHRAGRIFFP